MDNKKILNQITQIAIPTFTILGQLLIAIKIPKWGVLVNLAAQPFWFYSSLKAYKEAGQIGLLITTIILTIVFSAGVINYWIIG